MIGICVWERTTQWKVQVLRIHGDGNWLFSSLCHQLHGFALSSEAHKEGTKQLRVIVVKFIWDQRYRLRIQHVITTRILEEWPSSANLSYDEQVKVLLT